jgi:hypothetical protein
VPGGVIVELESLTLIAAPGGLPGSRSSIRSESMTRTLTRARPLAPA